MNPFITYTEEVNNQKRFFILQRAYPHIEAQILTHPSVDPIAEVKMPGYNFWLRFVGVIQGKYFPVVAGDTKDSTVKILSQMAEWYLAHRISVNENKYKKHITHADSSY